MERSGNSGGAGEEGEVAAREAGLRYVSDASPGIRRVSSGKGFLYVGTDGRRVKDPATLRRIRSLAIPPAYREVWICPDPHGHIQAVGRDDRGRKQYRYHPRWREVRDEHKYGRLIAFARALPRIRRRTHRDLARPGLTREKVLAAVVQLMEKTLIRVGNEEYARQNRSYGLTTLRNNHVKVRQDRLQFRFRGKSGKFHLIELNDPRLARVVRKCQELPGHELFEYVDADGEVRTVDSADVNDYLRDTAGEEFTAKDFRTWAGTTLAAQALRELKFESQSEAKRSVLSAIEQVAGRLGNTRAVCRKCYVHPEVVNAFLEGSLAADLARRARAAKSLPPEEAAVLALLQRRLAKGKVPLERLLKCSIRRAKTERLSRSA